jgi:hypothetical protein
MAKNASGYSVTTPDVPIILGMVNRGDRNHDIAAWFGLNQGRIKGAKDGIYGNPAAPNAESLLHIVNQCGISRAAGALRDRVGYSDHERVDRLPNLQIPHRLLRQS